MLHSFYCAYNLFYSFEMLKTKTGGPEPRKGSCWWRHPSACVPSAPCSPFPGKFSILLFYTSMVCLWRNDQEERDFGFFLRTVASFASRVTPATQEVTGCWVTEVWDSSKFTVNTSRPPSSSSLIFAPRTPQPSCLVSLLFTSSHRQETKLRALSKSFKHKIQPNIIKAGTPNLTLLCRLWAHLCLVDSSPGQPLHPAPSKSHLHSLTKLV